MVFVLPCWKRPAKIAVTFAVKNGFVAAYKEVEA